MWCTLKARQVTNTPRYGGGLLMKGARSKWTGLLRYSLHEKICSANPDWKIRFHFFFLFDNKHKYSNGPGEIIIVLGFEIAAKFGDYTRQQRLAPFHSMPKPQKSKWGNDIRIMDRNCVMQLPLLFSPPLLPSPPLLISPPLLSSPPLLRSPPLLPSPPLSSPAPLSCSALLLCSPPLLLCSIPPLLSSSTALDSSSFFHFSSASTGIGLSNANLPPELY